MEETTDTVYLRPLDLLLFAGSESVSSLISFIQNRSIEISDKDLPVQTFSHSGIVVTSDILDHPLIDPEKVYVFESTMGGGQYGDEVGNIDDMYNVPGGFLGVQIRDLGKLQKPYLKGESSKMAVARIKDHPFDQEDFNQDEFKKMFYEKIYKKI